ncbi:phosphotransferase [Aquihabitans daechungensis]|uniref:phosphotransferase n=1 Tax=Aquihabitans daechungensis TaxID=1052257 RepID=UPI003BA22BC5
MTDVSEAELEAALVRALRDATGPLTIGDLRRLSGGASRETWSFTAITGSDRLELVLQRVRGGLTMSGPSLETEDALLLAAEHAGVPVPPVVVGAPACADALGPARITLHVAGESLGPRIVRRPELGAARAALPAQCGRALAAIHSIDPAQVPGLEEVDTLQRLREGLDLVGEARPAFELALRWLADRRPPAREPRVVHGDFRVGNLLVDETGLQAVLDWELAHLGDPLEDLGWLCVRAWRFGGEGEVGGVGPLEDLLDAYGEASGTEVSADDVRWWIVAGTLTWGLICAVQARRHLDGHVRSVELATIGRRVCETEYDLLDLIGVTGPPLTPTRTGAATTGRHGRPSAAELVEAVREHLADVVAPQLDGAAAFQLKVAGNALRMVERELTDRPTSSLSPADEHQLAEQIRAGRAPRPMSWPRSVPPSSTACAWPTRAGCSRRISRRTRTCRRRGRS